MKVGILSFWRLANYGANLQGFSTYKYLEKHGYEPIFIDWAPEDYYDKKIANTINTQHGKPHFEFVDTYCKKTKRCVTDNDVCSVIEDESIDAIIVGSDAVLQHYPFLARISFPTRRIISYATPLSTTMFPNPFWGSFYRNLKIKVPIMMMSSCAQDSEFYFIHGNVRKSMANSLSQFSYISVRDDWTQKMVKYISKGSILPNITPDPVFAFNFNAGEYIPSRKEILEKYSLPEKYILVSFWSNRIASFDWLKELNKKTKEKGISCVAFPTPGGVSFMHNFDFSISKPLSPLDWYALIKYATGFVGEKMHPIIVSLHNFIPCFNFDHCGLAFLKGLFGLRYVKSSKIYHIMSKFDLLGNRITAKGMSIKIPSPNYVLSKLDEFDVEKCKLNADKCYSEYLKMMNDIEKILSIKH